MNNSNLVAIYCRLSKDDEQAGDSVSIETQKMMLTSYCANQNFDIFDIYIDDGYSGLNFNRPSFQRLIRDLEEGKFNIIVTKDLSRLGRDYIQTGYYMEVYFSSKQIRYIAVNDGIDTSLGNNDIAPFKNILNDMYAKDLSRKVKSAKLQRAKNGLYISSRPPYGYKADPYNRNRLIIDDEAAQVVKLIFELAQSFSTYSEISRALEEKKIVTPAVYKGMNGDTHFIKYVTREQMYKWNYQTVRFIICNQVYVGDMVNHKVEKINYKTKKYIYVPKEKQIIVANTHEPIIDRSVFEAINKKFSNRRKANHSYENVFKGIIFCSECGGKMQLVAKKLGDKVQPMFRCTKHFTDRAICTHNHYIYYDDLLNEIKSQLKCKIIEFINSDLYDELCAEILQSIYSKVQAEEKAKLQMKLHSLNKNIKERYKTISSRIDDGELEFLNNTQKFLVKKITSNGVVKEDFFDIDINTVKEIVKEHLQEDFIDPGVIGSFVSKIEIGYLEKNVSKPVTQKIKIYYRF